MDDTLCWAITDAGWRRIAAPIELPWNAAGYIRVALRAGDDGRVRAWVEEVNAWDGELADRLVSRFGHPPPHAAPDAIVDEATACANRVVGPRVVDSVRWDTVRDAVLAAWVASREPRPARAGGRVRGWVASLLARVRERVGAVRPEWPGGLVAGD